MAQYVIRVVGLAGSVTHLLGSRNLAGTFLEYYNPNAFGGRGAAQGTSQLDKAIVFDTVADALALWRQVSTVWPKRPDGKPNRPLTAFTVEVVPIPEDA